MIFDKRVRVLELAETRKNVFEWKPTRTVFAAAEPQAKTNLFSKVGIGAKTMLFSLRKTDGISLRNAFSVGGRFYFLTDIQDDGPILRKITAADIQPARCVAERTEDVGADQTAEWASSWHADFPAVLTEKYVKFEQAEPMARTETAFVLVTPKAIELRVSDLVRIDGHVDQEGEPVQYPVRVRHTLDEYKNEYEIVRAADMCRG